MSEQRFGPTADRIAAKYGIPKDLFRRLISAESSWNPSAGSHAGARGLAQLMPATARGLGVNNILDPVQNMTGGAKYLRQQYDKFKRWDFALAAYNAGPGAVSRYNGIPPYRETQNYVPKVLGGMNPRSPLATGQQLPQVGTPAGNPRDTAAQYAEVTQMVPGSVDKDRLWMLLENQRKRSLRGIMPAKGFMPELFKLAQTAMPRAETVTTTRAVGRQAAQTAAAVPAGFPKWTAGGGPDAHHSRALGNWQSDDAYDLMGKTGDPVYAGVNGTVTKISGQPGGDPGFAGYGITVRTPQGDFFFKHLGTKRVKVNQRVNPKTLLGTLDPKTAGGPHLHLGGTNRSALDALYRWYLNAGRR